MSAVACNGEYMHDLNILMTNYSVWVCEQDAFCGPSLMTAHSCWVAFISANTFVSSTGNMRSWRTNARGNRDRAATQQPLSQHTCMR